VSLSIDDFGTGYSSMSYLKRLPVDELKVDRSFVGGVITSAEDAALVRSVVDLGHNLGMEVVAEGVEDPLTTTALTELNCDVAQRFHFAHPAPAADIAVWLQRSDNRASARRPRVAPDRAGDGEVASASAQEQRAP
jgi:EAL domain-containing protein (putative c-di-GMP-specific phosphodiesterase class I)